MPGIEVVKCKCAADQSSTGEEVKSAADKSSAVEDDCTSVQRWQLQKCVLKSKYKSE